MQFTKNQKIFHLVENLVVNYCKCEVDDSVQAHGKEEATSN